MDQPATTYVSFWHVELENFPTGVFSKRLLSAADARDMVNAARASGTLVCVSREDLAAPYKSHARERHEQLCKLLHEHAGMQLQLGDFFGDACVNPTSFATVTKQSRLLVVDCHYTFDAQDATEPEASPEETGTAGRSAPRLRMSLAPDSLRFHIIEQVNESPLAASLPSIPALDRPDGVPDAVWLLAVEVFGSAMPAAAWFARPAMGLDRARPIDLVRSDAGETVVLDFLRRLSYGVYG